MRTVGEVTQAVVVLSVVCTAVNVVAAVVLARLSLPMRVRKWAARMDVQCDELKATVAKIEKEAKLWDSTINGMIEEAGDAFGRAERKRASLASKESRERGNAQVVDVDAMPRRERLDYRRAQMAGRR